jgi:hypothetical protein
MDMIMQSEPVAHSKSVGRLLPKKGQRIEWENISGNKFYGTVYEMDCNVAYVVDNNGNKYAIEC